MANKISDETIEYVGILAKLELSGQEKEDAKADMEKMLDYIDTLNELDTDGIEPMSHVFPVKNVFREDIVTNGLTAVELGKKIKAKEISVVEAVKASIAQIEKVEKDVNSFVTLDKEGALKRAEEVQKLIAPAVDKLEACMK